MVHWEFIEHDDFIAYEGEMTLRVEKMNHRWWWEVSRGEEVLDNVWQHEEEWPKTKEDAMIEAEEAMAKALIR